MGEYRYSDHPGRDRIDLLREKLQRTREETGDEVFLYEAVDGSVLFRSSRLNDEKVEEIAKSALRVERSEIHEIIGYDG
jgi:hypothetical protein